MHGTSAVKAGGQAAGVDRVKAVDVLGRIDRGDHPAGIDLGGERQLDQDPVDPLVGVELGDELQQLGLADVVSGKSWAKPSMPASAVALTLERT